MQDKPGQNGSRRVHPKFKRSDDPEISAGAPEAPEQIWILGRAGSQQFAFRSHDIRGQQVVQRATMLAHHPAKTAAQREPSDSRSADIAARSGQSKSLQIVIQFRPGNARLRAGRARLGIYVNSFHRRKVDDHAVIAKADARDVVARAAHRGQDAVPARKFDGRHHVGHSRATHNQGWMAVDHGVVDFPRFLVRRFAGKQQWPANRFANLTDGRFWNHGPSCSRRSPCGGF